MRRSAWPDALPGRRLLVVQTSFLGDVVLTTPLVSALRHRLRPGHLAVLVRPEAAPLLEGHPDVDEVLVDDKYGRDRGLWGLARTARRLRRASFDVAVSPHRSLRTALALAMAGVPRRVGFRSAHGAWLYHVRVGRDPERHDIERNLALLAPFGGPPVGRPRLFLPVSPAAQARAAELLPAGAGPLVGIAPGSVWRTKRWAPSGFAAVAAALAADGARVVIVGSVADRPVCEEVARASGCRAAMLAGQTDLATLVAVIDRCAVLVCNDSAPMHIAGARNIPAVAIFCATTPALGYGPWQAASTVLQADLACRPCGRHGGQRCPRGTEDCMRLVPADRVLAAVRNLLGHRTQAGSAAS